MEHEDTINIAKVALELGFIPILDNGKVPIMKGWQNIEHDEALAKINSYLKGSRKYNVGIVTGKVSGIVVIDVDVKDGGVKRFKKLLASHAKIETFVVKTGGGGYHYYFKYDKLSSKLHSRPIKGIGDIKTDGGQVVFLGSIHPDTKKVYYAYKGHTFDDDDHIDIKLASIPKFLFDYIQEH